MCLSRVWRCLAMWRRMTQCPGLWPDSPRWRRRWRHCTMIRYDTKITGRVSWGCWKTVRFVCHIIAENFGRELNLVVWRSTLVTANFKCANIFFAMAIWGPTPKFNPRQYFWLFGILDWFWKFDAVPFSVWTLKLCVVVTVCQPLGDRLGRSKLVRLVSLNKVQAVLWVLIN